ncbi:unnamed protein product [Rotaria socialis]|uniref:Uncharacterized protein n=1 Tax=Rotaria socialis TaxID=392032 RepID=A0A818DTM9_9BILA|nr:unnamed protein product [Rotaria socialis]CAF4348930.1 unnamed protein product [Rotaria socialis]
MAVSIAICITLIEETVELLTAVRSNRQLCQSVAVQLEMLYNILKSVDSEEQQRANKHHLKLVLINLQNLASRSKIIFERSQSNRILIRVKNFAQAKSIQDELRDIKADLSIAVGLLCLVFSISRETPLYRSLGITEQTTVDESKLADLEGIQIEQDYYGPPADDEFTTD